MNLWIIYNLFKTNGVFFWHGTLNDTNNKNVLTSWLSTLDKDRQKDFIRNLEYIIDEAENENPGKVTEYINGYKTIKFAKITSNQFDKYYQTATKVGIIALILFLMGIIGLFCLVLAVLAVERNTRLRVQEYPIQQILADDNLSVYEKTVTKENGQRVNIVFPGPVSISEACFQSGLITGGAPV